MRLSERHIRRPAAALLKIQTKQRSFVCEVLPIGGGHEIIELVGHVPAAGEMVRAPKQSGVKSRGPALDVSGVFERCAFTCFMNYRDNSVFGGFRHVDRVIM